MRRSMSTWSPVVVAVVLGVPAAGALAQGPGNPALSAPSQAKVGSAPTPAPTVKAGSGGAATAGKAASLSAALAACDLRAALAAGGTAQDAARILKGTSGSPTMMPETAAWLRNADSTGYSLGYRSAPNGGLGYTMQIAFGDYVPPGGIASLPTSDEAFGPPPPPAGPAAYLAPLGQKVMNGMSAQDAAKEVLANTAAPPRPGYVPSAEQANLYQHNRGGIGLQVPWFSPTGGLITSMIQLPGTENWPQLSTLPALNQPERFPVLRDPPEIAAQRLAIQRGEVQPPKPANC